MRVLFARAGALGDVLLLRRAIASLRRAGHQVSLLAPSAGAALVGPGEAEVDEWLPWDSADVARLLSDDMLGSPVATRLAACDAALVYSRETSLARGLERLGLHVVVQDPKPLSGVHAADHCRAPATGLGIPAATDVAPSVASEAEAAAADPLLRTLPPSFLAVHPGSGSPRKNWPAVGFAGLIPELSPHRAWLLVEGPADRDAASELRCVPGCVVARELPYRVLGAVLSRAGLFVGNDSGVSHLAAAWGAPTLVLFGPTDPSTWAPVGRRVTAVRSPTQHMIDLTLTTVLDAARGASGSPERIAAVQAATRVT